MVYCGHGDGENAVDQLIQAIAGRHNGLGILLIRRGAWFARWGLLLSNRTSSASKMVARSARHAVCDHRQSAVRRRAPASRWQGFNGGRN
jgi:hypothetical protein